MPQPNMTAIVTKDFCCYVCIDFFRPSGLRTEVALWMIVLVERTTIFLYEWVRMKTGRLFAVYIDKSKIEIS